MNKITKLIFNKKLLQDAVKINVSAAIEEDLKNIDKTSDILPIKTLGVAKIQAKQAAILCGSPWVNYCFYQIDKTTKIHIKCFIWYIKFSNANWKLHSFAGISYS